MAYGVELLGNITNTIADATGEDRFSIRHLTGERKMRTEQNPHKEALLHLIIQAAARPRTLTGDPVPIHVQRKNVDLR